MTEDFAARVQANKGKPMKLALEEVVSGKDYTVTVTPRTNPPKGQGALGIGFNFDPPIAILSYDTTAQKAFSGVAHTINLTKYNFQIFGSLFNQSFEQKSASPLAETVSGPVGISQVFKNIIDELGFSKETFLLVLNIAGLISVSLAIFNILPIPALDGGRFFFILFELITKKKVSPKFEGMTHAIGMAVLLGLILLITIRDVSKLF